MAAPRTGSFPAVATLLSLTAFAGTAQAADFILGAGRQEYAETDSTYIEAELHSRPLWHLGQVGFGLGLAGSYSDDDSSWLGAGVTMLYPFGQGWFIEGSFMPGLYDDGGFGTDLGSDLEFRSLLGIGHTLGAGSISLAINHMSNANTAEDNPGVNSVGLRYRIGF